MEGVGAALFVIFAVVFGLGLWALSTSMDKERIKAYIQERGGRVMSISWAPFGKGWYGEKNDRIYEVVYYDKVGNQHFATCKTGFWSGVYWTEDRVTHRKSKWFDSLAPSNEPGHPLIDQMPPEANDDDAEELRRLREENTRLREQLGQRVDAEDDAKCPACGTALKPETMRCPSCDIALR